MHTYMKEIYFENFHHYFKFNFIDKLEREFKHLSHGERVLFGQLINIYHYEYRNWRQRKNCQCH